MEQDESLTSAQRVFLQPSALEEEADFQATLAQLACTGLQWGGGLGLLGLLILVPVNVFLLGRPVAFWYPSPVTPEVFVLWDEAVGALLCSAAIWVGATQCRLSVARTVGSVIAGLLVAVSLVHDAVRGVLVIEYVILVYLLTVAAIPYRPWQALLLGGVITSLLAGIGLSGVLGAAGDGAELVGAGHLVRMGFVTVVFTGVSALLYVIRYRQHRARQEAEALHEQVARLERAKSRFFADLSHEFRTPLTLILGPLQDALEGRLGTVPDALRARLEGVEHQARRLKRLVDQLFDLARLDEGDVALAMQEHDLTALTQEVVPPLRQWAEENGLTFQMDVAPDRLDVWMDADRIRQLLTTLLSSAIRYTPEDGTVRLRVRRTDESAEIAVRDTGPGLPDALQKRVFGDADSYVPVGGEEGGEPAASLDAEQQIGLGIGLAHADALARRHGGRIDVESEPGFGTEWTVRLPLGREHVADEDVADPEAAVPRVDGAEPTGVPTSASTDTTLEPTDDAPSDAPAVLVVDDEAEMRTYLADLLGRNYQVVTATDGEAALDRLRDRPIDLVIGDVAMPGMDGVALCRAIRDDEQLRHLPVILLTARPEDRAQRANLEAGADAYVSKPFDPAELTARVENLIEIRRIVQDRVRLPDWMDPDEATVSPEEAEFVEALNEVMDTHIDNSNFGVDWLADEMDLSARHLRRRIKDTTGLSASGFIRTRRLQHAAALLRKGADTVSDVASAVGYRDPSYFSRLFRETFGCSPTEYAEQESEPPDEPDIGP
jgi:signal transduction histidine kinase/DNA-binding response OmpR family regulator